MKEKEVSKFKRNRLVAFSLAAIMAVSIGSVSASAESEIQGRASDSYKGFWENIFSQEENIYEDSLINLERDYKALASVSNKNVAAYKRKNIKVNGKLSSVKGVTVNGTEYIPFRQAANLLGASYKYDSAAKTSTMSLSGLTMSATSGNYVVYANNRALFSTSPTLIMSDGRMYIPAEIFAKAVGMTL